MKESSDSPKHPSVRCARHYRSGPLSALAQEYRSGTIPGRKAACLGLQDTQVTDCSHLAPHLELTMNHLTHWIIRRKRLGPYVENVAFDSGKLILSHLLTYRRRTK